MVNAEAEVFGGGRFACLVKEIGRASETFSHEKFVESF